ncbi:hypothetical protein Bbelb_133300 [Branchiostoma belcheri]|nr:hypothetical protein Bbelb_133300 [Branchiostoma belcheri]
MAKNGLNKQPYRNFNADETGFDLDQQKKKVVTFAHMKAPAVSVRMGTREHISCLECVAADGSAISPLVIFAKSVPSTAYSLEGPDNALYATSPSGFIEAEVFLQWLRKLKSKFEDAVQKISLVRPNYFVTKSTFCKVFMYKTSREHSLTMVEVKRGFKATGVYPIDESQVNDWWVNLNDNSSHMTKNRKECDHGEIDEDASLDQEDGRPLLHI